jgi:hypothetical protein
MSAERFVGTSARLLAGAAGLVVLGLGLVMRLVWQQTGPAFTSDGTPADGHVPFTDHLGMVMLDLGYRQLGSQLLCASALVGAAVALLHRIPSLEQARRLRWEVLAAGLLVLVLVMGLVAGNLHLATSLGAGEGLESWFDQAQLAGQSLAQLPALGASLLVLVAAALGWLRLAPATDIMGGDAVGDEVEGDDGTERAGPDDTDAWDGRVEPDRPHAASGPPRDSRERLASGVAEDFRHDWSPEDFQRPS